MIQISGKTYEVLQDYRNGWNPEAFRDRYSEVLERYDYIIGDWGYNQLRLKGFYRDNHPKANKDTSIAGIVDYINEYCNFGCAYFVLQKHKEPKEQKESKEPKDTKEKDNTEKVKSSSS
ncbi:YutD family protein [Neobacillus mesonae]|nr:YutD family protein [Neobacillus mesonae]